MELLEGILARRSVRRYLGQPLDEAEIRKLVEAAMAAPSASNLRPCHFVVSTRREKLDALAASHPHGKMLAEAPCAVAVCADPSISPTWWIQDCSAASENILLAAVGLGLGAVWLGCHPRPERVAAVRHILEIPGRFEVLSLISVGHPVEPPGASDRYDPRRDHREKW